jgi:hypothetical protein
MPPVKSSGGQIGASIYPARQRQRPSLSWYLCWRSVQARTVTVQPDARNASTTCVTSARSCTCRGSRLHLRADELPAADVAGCVKLIRARAHDLTVRADVLAQPRAAAGTASLTAARSDTGDAPSAHE